MQVRCILRSLAKNSVFVKTMSDLSVFRKKLTSHEVGSLRVEMAVICSLRPHRG